MKGTKARTTMGRALCMVLVILMTLVMVSGSLISLAQEAAPSEEIENAAAEIAAVTEAETAAEQISAPASAESQQANPAAISEQTEYANAPANTMETTAPAAEMESIAVEINSAAVNSNADMDSYAISEYTAANNTVDNNAAVNTKVNNITAANNNSDAENNTALAENTSENAASQKQTLEMDPVNAGQEDNNEQASEASQTEETSAAQLTQQTLKVKADQEEVEIEISGMLPENAEASVKKAGADEFGEDLLLALEITVLDAEGNPFSPDKEAIEICLDNAKIREAWEQEAYLQIYDDQTPALLDNQTITAGSNVYITGTLPEEAIAQALPVNVDIEGQIVLSAYDIAIYENEEQLAEGNTWQPEADTVQIHIIEQELDQIDNEEVVVYGMENVAAEASPSETAQIEPTEVVVDACESSIVAVTQMILEKSLQASDGITYQITLRYDSTAGIPSDAQLEITEIPEGSAEYAYYEASTLETLDNTFGTDELAYARFFDVVILSGGEKIEPKAPVNVSISYMQPLQLEEQQETAVIHFADDGIELLDHDKWNNGNGSDSGVSEFVFDQGSFSVTGTAVYYPSGSLLDNRGWDDLTPGDYALIVKKAVGRNYTYYAIRPDRSLQPVSYDPATGLVTFDQVDTLDELQDYLWTYSIGTSYFHMDERGRFGTFRKIQSVTNPSIAIDIKHSAGISNNSGNISKQLLNYSSSGYLWGYQWNSGSLRYLAVGSNNQITGGKSSEAVQIIFANNFAVDSGHVVIEDLNNGTLLARLDGDRVEGYQNAQWIWEKSNNGKAWSKVSQKAVSTENSTNDTLNISIEGGSRSEGTMYRVRLQTGTDEQEQAVYYQDSEGSVSEDTYTVPFYRLLQNPSFESPVIPDSDYYRCIPMGTAGLIWKTTAASGNIEIARRVTDYQKKQIQQQYRVLSNEDALPNGVQYAELNADGSGALYQDILTSPGRVLYWKLSHRGRMGKDTAYLMIFKTEDAIHYSSQSELRALIASSFTIPNVDGDGNVYYTSAQYPGARCYAFTDGNTKWTSYQGAVQVPEDWYLTRYLFVAGAVASGDESVGNLLDDVGFSWNVPAPVTGSVRFQIDKTILAAEEELSEEICAGIRENTSFALNLYYDEQHTQVLKQWNVTLEDMIAIDNEVRTYATDELKVEGLPVDTRLYWELVETTEDPKGYTRSTTMEAVRTSGDPDVSAEGLSLEGTITVEKGDNLRRFYITNSYEKKIIPSAGIAPTGVEMSFGPFIWMLVLGVLALAGVIGTRIRRRQK